MVKKRQAPKRVKVGKCWYVCGYNGKPINGLSWDRTTGYYYATHYKDDERWKKQKSKTPIRFGKDYATAICQFRQWQQEVDDFDETLDLVATVREPRSEKDKAVLRQFLADMDAGEEILPPGDTMDERVFGTDLETALHYYRQGHEVDFNIDLPEPIKIQVIKDFFAQHTPTQLAEILGIPGLANLDLVSVNKAIRLKTVFDAYLNQPKIRLNANKNRNQRNELQKVETTWKKFLKVTQAKTLKDITISSLVTYHEAIYAEFINEDKSTSFFNGAMERVKRVFNAFRSDSPDFTNAIVRLKQVLKGIENKRKTQARMINRQELHTILNASTVMEKAIWLMSLNCGLYGIEVAYLSKKHLDIARKTCIYRRTKNENHRAAMLWEETIDALQKYQEESRHESETVFVNYQGKRFADDGIGKLFTRFKKRVGLDDTISHDNFRDSFLSVGKLVKREKHIDIIDSIKVVLGHKQDGSEGNYIDPEIAPEISAAACEAVREYYFGENGE